MPAASLLPLRQLLPVPGGAAEVLLADPDQHAFREALRAVADLRQQLGAWQAAQAEGRRTYWQQVGPLAAATVAARRALYAPLEAALLGGYLTRAEQGQVTELLVAIARDLEVRFGEDEADLLARYAPPSPPPDPADQPDPAEEVTPPVPAPDPDLLPHEQHAAAARARRQQRAAARAAQANPAQELPASLKQVYREVARRIHPDRAAQADATAQQTHTARMQQATAAYAAADLATLLTLLAEAPAPTDALPDQILLTRYSQALTRQRTDLARQLAEAQAAPPPWGGTPKQQRTRLRDTKAALRDELVYLDHVARQFREPASLRQWLRENRNAQP